MKWEGVSGGSWGKEGCREELSRAQILSPQSVH